VYRTDPCPTTPTAENSPTSSPPRLRPYAHSLFTSPLPMTPNHSDQYEAYGAAGYVKAAFHEETGGYLVIHPAHGQNEWEQNKRIGRMLAALGDAVVLVPNQPDKTSCDALRNGEEWEFKTIGSTHVSRSLQQALRRGKTQAANVLCLVTQAEFEIHELTLGIYGAVKFDTKQELQRVSILFLDGRLIEMSREEVRTGVFIQKFSL
jgi:hypothetical protein